MIQRFPTRKAAIQAAVADTVNVHQLQRRREGIVRRFARRVARLLNLLAAMMLAAGALQNFATAELRRKETP